MDNFLPTVDNHTGKQAYIGRAFKLQEQGYKKLI